MTILLLILSLSVTGQKKYESVKVIGIYSGSILMAAVGDGLNHSGSKEWGHACNAMSVGVLLASPFVIDYNKSKIGYYLTSYTALRIAMFDPMYNATRGLPLTYVGGTSTWDKAIQRVPDGGMLFARGWCFSLGIVIPIKEFR